MTKHKINFRKKRLPTNRIQKHQNFNSLYSQYQGRKERRSSKNRLRVIVLASSVFLVLLVYGITLLENKKEIQTTNHLESKTKTKQKSNDDAVVNLLELTDNQALIKKELNTKIENPASEPEFKNRIASYSDNSEVVSVFYIEKPAQPFGGFEGFYKNYIKKNLIYPEDAKEKRLKGKVYLQFVVEKDGSISNIEVMSGLIPSCNKEAVRLMQNSPKWRAASYKNGKSKQTIAMPISFEMIQ